MAYDRYFKWIHGNHLIYNTCWEDPRIDRDALEIDRDSRVLVITSAGCNALDYVLAGAGSVHAVDVNPRQNALLELKLAAIRTLSFSEFFLLFGRGYHPNFPVVYRAQLRPLLSSSAQAFWDTQTDLFTVNKRYRGFYDRGTSGLVARMTAWYIRCIAGAEEAVEAMFHADSTVAQKRIYLSEVKPKIWGRVLQGLARSSIVLSLLGVPRAQRDLVARSHPGGVSGFIEACLDAVFTTLPLHDNYFWRVYLIGGYTETCCPEYLTLGGFSRLKDGLWERISVSCETVSRHLARSSQFFSHAVLLDHMDWLYTHDRTELAREWQGLISRTSERMRIIWRSAADQLPDLETLPVQAMGRRTRLGEILSYHRSKASQLHSIDRVHTYQSFHIADLMPAQAS